MKTINNTLFERHHTTRIFLAVFFFLFTLNLSFSAHIAQARPGDEEFLEICQRGNIGEIHNALKEGVNPNAQAQQNRRNSSHACNKTWANTVCPHAY